MAAQQNEIGFRKTNNTRLLLTNNTSRVDPPQESYHHKYTYIRFIAIIKTQTLDIPLENINVGNVTYIIIYLQLNH